MPATIVASAISVHRIERATWKTVESNIASTSQGTSRQWWTVRATSTDANAMAPIPAGSAQ